MKPTCILHVGMPKTGTTSIQVSLANGLRDPAFHYIHPGHSQSAMFLESLFSERPEDFWLFRHKGFSRTRLRWMRWSNGRRFRRILEQARDGSVTPLLSAERWWIVPPSYLEGLRDFLHRHGFRVHVVVYVRPIKSWIESCFQEEAKWHGLQADSFPKVWETPDTRFHRCSKRLGEFERVFGRENLTVRPFVRGKLKEGCAVRDFCDLLGIRFEPDRIVRRNEAVCMDAVKFLHAYDRFDRGRKGPPLHVPGRWQLVRCLEGLEGSAFRFHSEALAPILKDLESDARELAVRHGIQVAEDIQASDGGPCVREEADMYRYSEEALEWLAKASGSRPMAVREGERAAREVAVQVDLLKRRLILRRRASFPTRLFHAARRRLLPRA